MAGTQRQRRVQGSLKEVISEALQKVKDPRLGFVTLTDVEVSPDLSYARVFYSTYGSDEERKNSTQAVLHAAGFLRREVAHHMQLRHTPELDFRLDTTPDKAERIMKVFEQIHEEERQRALQTDPPVELE